MCFWGLTFCPVPVWVELLVPIPEPEYFELLMEAEVLSDSLHPLGFGSELGRVQFHLPHHGRLLFALLFELFQEGRVGLKLKGLALEIIEVAPLEGLLVDFLGLRFLVLELLSGPGFEVFGEVVAQEVDCRG